MKTKNKFALVVLTTLGLAACSNDDDVQIMNMQDKPIIYSADISELSTRANQALLEGSFGLYLATDGTQEAKYNATNLEVKYTNGQWKSSSQLYWKDNNTNVTFHAYMPYNNQITDVTQYPITISTTQTSESQKTDDFCYAAEQTSTATSHNGNINVNFAHELTKLKINLTAASELSKEVTFETVSVNNTIISATYNLNNGTLTPSDEFSIINLSAGKNNTFEGILIPQTYDKNLTITIKASNGKKYQFVSSEKLAFNSGISYELNLIVGRDKVTLGQITANPWVTVNGGNLTIDYTI